MDKGRCLGYLLQTMIGTQGGSMSHDLFISHAEEDKAIATRVCSLLESRKITCWIAPRNLPPGMSYGKAIIEAINNSRAMLLVFSSRADASPHVEREVERAINRGVPVLPFRIEDILPSGALEYFLAGQQWLDAVKPPIEEPLQRLACAVEMLLSTRHDAASETAPVRGHVADVSPVPDTVELVLVRGGAFRMGDTFGDGDPGAAHVHEVRVSDFFIGKYAVLQREWEREMGSVPALFPDPLRPVERVSWDDVQEFITRLNVRTGGGYRLPTEAEWEYAARSRGKDERWAGTSDAPSLGDFGWFYHNSRGTEPAGAGQGAKPQTQPVGQKKPNGLGLYDMSGNVWEWCEDWYAVDYYESSPGDDPRGPEWGTHKVRRGGSWIEPIDLARTDYRGNSPPAGRSSNIGFRLARDGRR